MKHSFNLIGKLFLALFPIIMCSSCSDEPASTIVDSSLGGSFSIGPNAVKPINFENYLGNCENIHPKVLYFENGWNGYRFWMAYTPYPLGAIAAENPCVAVSDDGINWKTPTGLKNPLFNQFSDGYNSDTHLVYRESDGVLECWWRPHIESKIADLICRRTTKDGINWTEPETVVPLGETGNLRMSPSLFIKDGKYVMFYATGRLLYEMHCDVEGQKFQWSQPRLLEVPQGDLFLWHLDVIPSGSNDIEIIACAFPATGGGNNAADLYYIKGDMNKWEFSSPVLILPRSHDPNAIDYRSIYRASLVKVKNRYFVYYSSIDNDWHRHMALSIGDSVFDLKGYNPVSN